MRRLFVCILLCALGCFASGCRREEAAAKTPGGRALLELSSDDTACLASVAPFQFTSSEGRRVTEKDLLGAVWVVDFFFTTCSGPCPRITSQMRALQDELAGSSVRLVSISVDPATDSPEVLRDYAARVGADLSRWCFLSGDEAKTDDLIRSSFALPIEHDKGAQLGFQVSHATKLVVVDGRGRVRGYYAGETPEGRAMARDRALWLSRHVDS